MTNDINEKIKDNITKVCICKAINRTKIKSSIKDGAKTVEEVMKDTGAGTGGCKGSRCIPTIQKLLQP